MSARPHRGFPGGGGFITPADKAFDEALAIAQKDHGERIRTVAEGEGLRVLGADLMALARWKGPNEFTIGRRQFAVTVGYVWAAGKGSLNGVANPILVEYPVLYFRNTQGGGHRGGVRDFTPVRSLCEIAEKEEIASSQVRRG